jgi:hypothetical protein
MPNSAFLCARVRTRWLSLLWSYGGADTAAQTKKTPRIVFSPLECLLLRPIVVHDYFKP